MPISIHFSDWDRLKAPRPKPKRPKRGGDGAPATVEPDKPKPLEGGAAAPLEFDE